MTSSTKDPEIAEWLKTGPVLGAHKPIHEQRRYVTLLNAKDFTRLPKTLLVTCGLDMLRDVGHAYAGKLAEAGNDITYAHYPDLAPGIIQMTMHSRRCLEATEEIARLLAAAFGKRA